MTNEGESRTVRAEPANPLTEMSGLPRFDTVRPDHVEPGMAALLAELGAELDALERDLAASWEGLIERLERIHERLAFSWGIVQHLMNVKNSPELREAHGRVEPRVVQFTMRLGQSEPIYRGLKALRAGEGWNALDPAQKRIVEKLIQDAELAGVGLEGERRERFNAVKLELARLSTEFGNHLLDATKGFALTLRSEEEMAGLPRSFRELAARAAREAGEAEATAERGPWRITLEQPSYVGFMKHSRRRDLREALYRANVTKASSGEYDNTPLIRRILLLRKEEASLLGFGSYAELSLSTKMAGEVAAVERLLEELRSASYEPARRDLEELRELARAQGAPEGEGIAHWDTSFWAERLRERRFDYREEDLRPYFPLPRVLEGLFELAERLFDVEVRPADGAAPVWHPDVRFFRVFERGGEEIAGFYLDPYSRPSEKRSGAWMDEVVGRSRLLAPEGRTVRLPVAHLVCNGTPPLDGQPPLMTFREVETLFHEFGHTLQHVLTRVDYGLAAGIRNVEWDAVELPSQFMENWCYHRKTLRGLTAHVETGEPLPEEVFEKIRAARTFRSGSEMLRQLHFAFTDLELHHRFDPEAEESPFDVERRVARNSTVLPPLPEDRFLCSFAHIFQGAYAAGYYSYKWAEVLSADAFAAFEDAGIEDERAVAETGKRFRETILALGGSQSPQEVFVAFRGREPSTRALLRHQGLVAA